MPNPNNKNNAQKCCNNCEHSYYVYGCEIACEYEDKCGTPTYKFFKKKEKDK